MKSSRRIICGVCLAVFFATGGSPVFADDKKKDLEPKGPEWMVRIEVLMVAMPEAKFIDLLPDLQDEAKIEGVIPDLWAAIKKKEMILRGYPIVVTKAGQRAVTETIQEVRYPTEFDPPTEATQVSPGTAPGTVAASGSAAPIYREAWPTSFETRNCGTSVEVEPTIPGNGDWIDLNIVPQDVELLGFESYTGAFKKVGEMLTETDPRFKVDQPEFSSHKVTTSISLRNGRWMLLVAHKMVKPEGSIEVFLVHAVATAVK